MSGDQKQKLAQLPTQNQQAYQLYVKGRYFQSRWSPADRVKALEFFQQAIAIDASYAAAYAGEAEVYTMEAFFRESQGPEKRELGLAAAKRAVELDGTLAEAHAALGLSLFLDLKWTDGQRELEQAVSQNANSITAHMYYGWYLAFVGRLPEALRQMNLAQALDPLSFAVAYTTGNILYWHREYDRSIEQYRKALEIQPGNASAVGSTGDSYLEKNQCSEATEYYAREEELGGNPDFAAALRNSYKQSGCRGMIQKQLELDRDPSSRDYAPFDAAVFAAMLGKKDEAFRLLEKAYAERTGIVFLKIEPELDSLRPDPRYADLLRRVGLGQ